jgi:hypothetical protein
MNGIKSEQLRQQTPHNSRLHPHHRLPSPPRQKSWRSWTPNSRPDSRAGSNKNKNSRQLQRTPQRGPGSRNVAMFFPATDSTRRKRRARDFHPLILTNQHCASPNSLFGVECWDCALNFSISWTRSHFRWLAGVYEDVVLGCAGVVVVCALAPVV